ncbi:putative purine permease 11 isoform X1 [Cucumis melo var. makuwa]|uniref:Probable purine permease n=1 Tax=Cucumis melo var. makuwa TaxID=1194695 RepID=A0A5D3CJ57_CUCMM|nr:putative purine permease 11 isoform X1 [Cucumis melo var. makuwa]TYK10259.1 putative purine permease 11 isoform X1 [Cucumis melo var. makuwa]
MTSLNQMEFEDKPPNPFLVFVLLSLHGWKGNQRDQRSNKTRKLERYTRWSRIGIYTIFLVCGQSAATLLGRLYYDKGGNSKWMATLVQSAGFPILLPFLWFFSQPTKSSSKQPNFLTFSFICFAFGLLLIGDNLMYSYGLLYLPVSTYSLLCATQLAFNALLSFFLNAQKFTPYILNSLVLLTVSASLLAFNSESDTTTHSSKGKYVIGFLCTLGASATYSLYLCLLQVCFEKVIKRETFSIVLDMQIYPSIVASCGCVVGLFGSGEWRGLRDEMRGYEEGRVSYFMTLVWTAVTWQVSSVGLLGLIFEVSSLFSNVISTLALPVVPILAVIFFHDKMNGVKAMALVLALWGFVSYIYQNYLDESKAKANQQSADNVSTV